MAQISAKEVTDSLAATVGEFVANVDLAAAVARKWKCRAQAIDKGVFALYDDSVAVKAILVVAHDDTFVVPAKHVSNAIEWALWCRTSVVFAGPAKRITFNRIAVDKLKGYTMPFVSESGVVVDLGAADRALNKPDTTT